MKFRTILLTAVLATVPALGRAADEKKEKEEPKIETSGFVDLYFSVNTAPIKPAAVLAGAGSTTVRLENRLRNFDFRDRSPSLNLAEVVIQKAPHKTSKLGFRIDLNAGPTTDWVHLADPSGPDTVKFFQQAYVTWKPNEKTTIDFGKWVTAHGAEVIETKDNANYTRSLLFAWAIPYYHTGLRIHRHFSSQYMANIHVVQGWNNTADNNGNKTLGFTHTWTPNSRWSITQTYMTGKEPNGVAAFTHNAPSGDRDLFDNVISYTADPKTTFTLNFDYGRQGGSPAGAAAKWYGVAGYVKRQLSGKSSFTLRGEVFRDHNAFNMPIAPGFTGQTANEITATYEFRSMKNLMHRLELRHDWSSAPTFANFSRGRQTSVVFGTVLTF